MIDLAATEGFDWDDGNARKSLDKHGVTQPEAEQVFAGGPLLAEDYEHSQSEVRYQALGETSEGRPLHVTFTLREDGKRIRIISARDMNRKERAYYEKET
jgi:uncharacterized protein